jgi:hypothetical protein
MSQNGSAKKSWNLLDDGVLWRAVIDGWSKESQAQARTFVMQLQEAVKPKNALQGVLLDRIASSYFRKQLFLEVETALRSYMIAKNQRDPSGPTKEAKELSVVAFSQTTGLPWSGNTLRQEAILDHAFQRDLILLQTLQSASGPAAASPARRSLKSENKQIDGEINGSAVS